MSEHTTLWTTLNCFSQNSPPRPLASRRVEAVTKQQTLQTSQNLQTNLLGGGFTLPLPPPTASDCSLVRSAGVLRPPWTLQKVVVNQ